MATAPDIVGRDDELRALTSLLDAGTGFVVVLEGAPGSGKTTLVDATVTSAAGAGWDIRRTAAHEGASTEPLSVASSLLGLEVAAAAPTTVQPLVDALTETTRSTLVIVDDAQWIDAASVDVLREIARGTSEAAIGLVVAARPSQATAIVRLRGALARAGAMTIPLLPLEDGAAAAIARGVASSISTEQLHAVVAAGSGNPFLLRELAAAARDDDVITGATAAWHALGLASPATRAVLDTAAVIATDIRPADLATVAGHDHVSVGDAIREAVAIGVLVEDDRTLRFRHDLFREALYDALQPAIRADLHARAVNALAARGAPKLRIAEHVRRAAVAPDDRAATWLLEAAGDAAADPSVATGLLEHADALAVPDGPVADTITERLVPLLAWSGRSTDSIERARQLLSRTPTRDRQVRIRTRLAEALALSGAEREAGETALEALALRGGDELDEASLHVVVAVGTWDSRPRMAEDHLTVAMRLADEHDLPMVRVWSLALLALVRNVDGHFQDSVDIGERAVAEARALVDAGTVTLAPSYLTWTLMNFAESLIHVERYDDALRAYADAERWVRLTGSERARSPDLHIGRALIDLWTARWDDARTEIEARQELLRDLGMADHTTSGALETTASLTARVACLSGNADEATERARAWEAAAPNAVDRARSTGWLAHARLVAGDHAGAVDAINRLMSARDEIAATEDGISPVRAVTPLFCGWLAVAALDAGRADVATVLAADARTSATVAPTVPFRAADADAAVAAVEGDIELAQRAARTAMDVRSPVLRAVALVGAANALDRLGADSTEVVERAVRTCDAHGVSVATALRARRSTRVERSRRPATGWASLTPTEAKVTDRVAAGLSNRQIAEELYVSRYTVETHLKHIFRKLRITSRVQLAAMAVEQRERADRS